ncbi:MAG: proprotein convertase P-domain-containing protein [Anaerolineae bacterium]
MRKVVAVGLILVLLLGSVSTGGGVLAEPPEALSKPGAGTPAVSVITPADPAALPLASAGGGAVIQGLPFLEEQEPNDSAATATPITGSSAVILANIIPTGDHDYFSFTAEAGDRVYAATMTGFSGSEYGDTYLAVLDANGVVIEEDYDDGTYDSFSSSIAGAVIPAAGTYYLKVTFQIDADEIRPYHLHFKLQHGAPVAGLPPSGTPAAAVPLPVSGWVSGAFTTTSQVAYYSLELNAGDTVFASLDMDPQRSGQYWTSVLGMGFFNGLTNATYPDRGFWPGSQAFFTTVKYPGTYYIFVANTAASYPSYNYNLSVAVYPAQVPAGTCTTYPGSGPLAMADGGVVTTTIHIPGHPIVADLDVSLDISHTLLNDVELVLEAPGGNKVVLYYNSFNYSNHRLDIILDDEASVPVNFFSNNRGLILQPQHYFRLGWFDGQDAGGDWTLYVYDKTAGNTGTLESWGLTVCEPPAFSLCPSGTHAQVLYASDFEAGNGGFSSSGVNNAWEWGTPTYAPLDSCASGTQCWKTNLDGKYPNDSTSYLDAPSVDLTGQLLKGAWLTWQQKYQFEIANFDRAYVDVAGSGGETERAWIWTGDSMTAGVGGVTGVVIQESAGWGLHTYDISSFLGQTVDIRFALESDVSNTFAGMAVDDVQVLGCIPNDVYVPRVSK